MRLTHTHARYWSQRTGPQWARKLPGGGAQVVSIHDCINEHAGISQGAHLDVSNTAMLVRMARNRGENIVTYLDRLIRAPGTVIRPDKRAAACRRWKARIRRTTQSL